MKVHENSVHYVDMCPVKSDELKRDQIFFFCPMVRNPNIYDKSEKCFSWNKDLYKQTFLPCKKKYKNYENLRQIANC